MKNMPFLFHRQRLCTPENGLVPNMANGTHHCAYVVMLAAHTDLRHYNSAWMGDPILGPSTDNSDLVYAPDVDIVNDDNVWIFDGPNLAIEYARALQMVKALWSGVEVDMSDLTGVQFRIARLGADGQIHSFCKKDSTTWAVTKSYEYAQTMLKEFQRFYPENSYQIFPDYE